MPNGVDNFWQGCHLRNSEDMQKQEITNKILLTDYVVANLCFFM